MISRSQDANKNAHAGDLAGSVGGNQSGAIMDERTPIIKQQQEVYVTTNICGEHVLITQNDWAGNELVITITKNNVDSLIKALRDAKKELP